MKSGSVSKRVNSLKASSSRLKTIKVNWKKKQRNTQEKNKLKLAFLALGILVLLILFGKFIGFVTSLNKPYSPDGVAVERNLHWDGLTPINLVVKSTDIFLFNLNPTKGTILILKIPDDVYINLPLGFGSWPARSIYDLGQSENPPFGAQLLKKTFIYSYAIPVAGYIIEPESTETSFDSKIKSISKNPWSFISYTNSIKTDLTPWELYHLALNIRMIRSDKFEVVDLTQSQITESFLLPDKSRALAFDAVKLDQFLQNRFEDEKLIEEGLSIGIFNATDHSLLAERAARVITNLGGRVIFSSNSKSNLPHSLIIGKSSYTTQRALSIFTSSCNLKSSILDLKRVEVCKPRVCLTDGPKFKECLAQTPEIEPSRADVSIYLGEDYYTQFNRSSNEPSSHSKE